MPLSAKGRVDASVSSGCLFSKPQIPDFARDDKGEGWC
jgi:hypothetical protein